MSTVARREEREGKVIGLFTVDDDCVVLVPLPEVATFGALMN
jgi:hypothetical protein